MEKQFERTLDLLEALAKKSGMTAESFWPYLIRQVYIESITWIMIFVPFSIFLILLGNYGRYKWDDDGNPIPWLLIIIGVAVLCLSVGVNVAGILNPEYWAAKDLATIVGTALSGSKK